MGEKTCTLRKAERSVNLSAGGGSEGDRRCRRAWAPVARVGSSGGADLLAVQARVGSDCGAGERGLRWRCRHAWAPVARVGSGGARGGEDLQAGARGRSEGVRV
jgi:hypothetical protein